jgi:hypothetical protein
MTIAKMNESFQHDRIIKKPPFPYKKHARNSMNKELIKSFKYNLQNMIKDKRMKTNYKNKNESLSSDSDDFYHSMTSPTVLPKIRKVLPKINNFNNSRGMKGRKKRHD